jgi:hypothetical protein
MKFRYLPKRRRHRPGAEERTFAIGRLWKDEPEVSTEITHLFDRTYGYRSPRELAWHLAARFGVPPSAVRLEKA